MLYLDIPYADKDEAKKLGSINWDAVLKKWYISNRSDYKYFKKWLLKDNSYIFIVCDYIYIIEIPLTCSRCKEKTNYFSLGIVKHFTFLNDERNYFDMDDICFCDAIYSIPNDFYNYIIKNEYFKNYPKTIKSKFTKNHCRYCNALNDAYHELYEPSNIYKIKLKNDMIMDIEQAGFSLPLEDPDNHIVLDYVMTF